MNPIGTLPSIRRNVGVLRRHGFRLHLRRLTQAPRVDLASGQRASLGAGERTLALRGVVCGVCAARTESALTSVPGVESARVDLDGSRAVVRLSPGAEVDAATLQRALEHVVVGMGARRRIEGLAGRLGNLAGRTSWQRSSR